MILLATFSIYRIMYLLYKAWKIREISIDKVDFFQRFLNPISIICFCIAATIINFQGLNHNFHFYFAFLVIAQILLFISNIKYNQNMQRTLKDLLTQKVLEANKIKKTHIEILKEQTDRIIAEDHVHEDT